VLPKSSCKRCAAITGAWTEQITQRKTLLNLRTRFKTPTRNPKDRPEKFLLKIYHADGTFTLKELDSDDLPIASWALPVFGMPILASQIDRSWSPPEIKCMVSNYDANRLVLHSDSEEPVGIEFPMNAYHFQKMLAKIAYSYTMAETDGIGISPLFQKIILSEDVDPKNFVDGKNPNFLVGSLDEIEPPADYLFEIGFGGLIAFNGIRTIVVRIRLFSCLATPTYIIAMGIADQMNVSPGRNRAFGRGASVGIRDPKSNILIPLGNFLGFQANVLTEVIGPVVKIEAKIFPNKEILVQNVEN
jgi:hypothetical protein